jgi:hypothetical protein
MVHNIEHKKLAIAVATNCITMGEDKREQLEFIPASIKTIEHVSLKYSCRHFEQRGAEVAIKIAPVCPPQFRRA